MTAGSVAAVAEAAVEAAWEGLVELAVVPSVAVANRRCFQVVGDPWERVASLVVNRTDESRRTVWEVTVDALFG